jgi:hypothetical protein
MRTVRFGARLADLVPTPLVSGLAGRTDNLVVGPDALYFSGWVDSKGPDGVLNAIFRAPLPSGLGLGALPEFVRVSQEPGDDSVGGMTRDEANLYWGDKNLRAIERCPLSGCREPDIVAVGQEDARALKEDPASLYWSFSSASLADVAGIARLAK